MRVSEGLQDKLILSALVLFSRFLFRSHYLYHMDSVNFALGLSHFSPVIHQPQPPGYFLYIQLGRLAQIIFPDPNSALILISILSSIALVIIVYELALTWFGRNEARISGLLFVFSPLAWFHGVVALSYILEACMTGLFGLLCWHLYKGRISLVFPVAIIFGLCVGIRQSAIIFFAPLWLFSLQHLVWSKKLLALFVFSITVVAWFLPMLWVSGGLEAYSTSVGDYINRVSPTDVAPTELFIWSKTLATHTLLMLVVYSLCFVTAAPLIFLRKLPVKFKDGLGLFLTVWLAPGLIFFIFIFFSPNNFGHLLFLTVPLFAVIGSKAVVWYEQVESSIKVKISTVGMFVLIHIATFLFAPLYTSYRYIYKFEQDLASIQNGLRKIADPKNTVVVAMDAHWFGFRHAGYYLPEYVVFQYPEMQFSSGIQDFVMHDRDTNLFKTLPINQYSQFVIFPFPSSVDQEDINYIFGKFPKGLLFKESVGGYIYMRGRAADLGILFPSTAKAFSIAP
jgi:hypothetical protein